MTCKLGFGVFAWGWAVCTAGVVEATAGESVAAEVEEGGDAPIFSGTTATVGTAVAAWATVVAAGEGVPAAFWAVPAVVGPGVAGAVGFVAVPAVAEG